MTEVFVVVPLSLVELFDCSEVTYPRKDDIVHCKNIPCNAIVIKPGKSKSVISLGIDDPVIKIPNYDFCVHYPSFENFYRYCLMTKRKMSYDTLYLLSQRGYRVLFFARNRDTHNFN